MAIEVWREIFCYKISSELNEIKLKMLQKSKEEIWASAYQIDCIINIYEILLEISQRLDVSQMKYWIQTSNLLALLYSEWMNISDSAYKEMECSIWSVITRGKESVA